MKRKDFLRKMRNRRHGDVQPREPERRRAIDWRTLRVELPASGDADLSEDLPAGTVTLATSGISLAVASACWVRGYRQWIDEEGRGRAEFQYRPNEDGDPAPPGAIALEAGEVWSPEG